MPASIWIAITLLDVVGLGLGVWLLWGRAPGAAPSPRRDAVVLIAWGAALGLGALVVARFLPHARFALLRL